MRSRILPFALAALLTAPAGFLLAQPSSEPTSVPETTPPPAFVPGDVRPAPQTSEGPAESPQPDTGAPIAPRGWVPDEDEEAGTAALPPPATPTADEALPDGQPGGGAEVQLGPDGLFPMQTSPDGSEAEAALPRHSDDPTADETLPDGQSGGGEEVRLGPDGLFPMQTSPDGSEAEAALPQQSDDPSADASQPGGVAAPVAPDGWLPDGDSEAGTVALPQPGGSTGDEARPGEPGAQPEGDVAAPLGPDGSLPMQTDPDSPDVETALPLPPDAGDQDVEALPAQAATASGLREPGDYVAIRERPLFAPNRSPPRVPEPDPLPEVVVAEPDPLPEPAVEVEEVFVETAPDWELVGMVRSERLNSAMFRKFGEADGFSLRRGESRDGWVLSEIRRFEVVLENEHGQALLTFPEN